MAVTLVTSIKNFIGLSTDTKPTDAPAGSDFFETNTGHKFIFDGTNWVECISIAYVKLLSVDERV
jgi:hypothetical protein